MGAELNLDLCYLPLPPPETLTDGDTAGNQPQGGTAGAPGRAARAQPALPGRAELEELVELVFAARAAPAAKAPRERRRDVGIAAHPGPATGTSPGSCGIPPAARPAP